MLVIPKARRFVLPAIAIGAVGVFAALALVPGLHTKVDTRLQDESPVWDRYNTNSAAIRMVEARPLFGFGWQTFVATAPDYMRQADTYPLTGANLEVHNVFLSHAAELGLVGSALWTAGLFGAVGGAIVRRGPPELLPWRVGLIAIFVAFLSVASFGPLSYPFPNLLLWTWAGIAGTCTFLVPRAQQGRLQSVSGGGSRIDWSSA
jgi:O-antigen ligase